MTTTGHQLTAEQQKNRRSNGQFGSFQHDEPHPVSVGTEPAYAQLAEEAVARAEAKTDAYGYPRTNWDLFQPDQPLFRDLQLSRTVGGYRSDRDTSHPTSSLHPLADPNDNTRVVQQIDLDRRLCAYREAPLSEFVDDTTAGRDRALQMAEALTRHADAMVEDSYSAKVPRVPRNVAVTADDVVNVLSDAEWKHRYPLIDADRYDVYGAEHHAQLVQMARDVQDAMDQAGVPYARFEHEPDTVPWMPDPGAWGRVTIDAGDGLRVGRPVDLDTIIATPPQATSARDAARKIAERLMDEGRQLRSEYTGFRFISYTDHLLANPLT